MQCTPVVNTDVLGVAVEQASVTIGAVLEATARNAGEKPVDRSDAAAIQAAEVRATGSNVITPGGIAATAHSAADLNLGMDHEEDKITLGGDVLVNATIKLQADKAVSRQDAKGVISAELRNNPNLTTHQGEWRTLLLMRPDFTKE